MREREAKEREEILKEDGREIGWMKEIWKRREMIEKENVNFLELHIFLKSVGQIKHFHKIKF
jgi:hypothetical protein